MTDISDLGLEIIINPIKRVRLQFHAGLWYVEYQRKPQFLIDGWWWFDDSKYPEYKDAYNRAIALAEQKGTKEIRHKTLTLDVEQ